MLVGEATPLAAMRSGPELSVLLVEQRVVFLPVVRPHQKRIAYPVENCSLLFQTRDIASEVWKHAALHVWTHDGTASPVSGATEGEFYHNRLH